MLNDTSVQQGGRKPAQGLEGSQKVCGSSQAKEVPLQVLSKTSFSESIARREGAATVPRDGVRMDKHKSGNQRTVAAGAKLSKR